MDRYYKEQRENQGVEETTRGLFNRVIVLIAAARAAGTSMRNHRR